MAGGELPAWNVVVPIPVRIAAQQMFGPFVSDDAMERPVKMDFDPEIPGSDDGEKKQQIRPPKKRAKPYPRLAIKDRQRGKGRRRKKQSMRTFDQTCEGGENPESGKQIGRAHV